MKTKTYIIGALILVIGVVLGATLFDSNTAPEDKHNHVQQTENSVWTCSMHPQIRKDESGDCPICGMDLIPASSMKDNVDPNAIRMSKTARQLAKVETMVVGNQNFNSNLNLTGRLEINQNKTQSVSANYKARIEKLYINEEGEAVSKNQIVAELYAPEIQVLKNEFELASQQNNSNLLNSIKTKIKNYELSISDVKTMNNGRLKLRSPKTGIVNKINVEQGDNVNSGHSLMQIADLSSLWAILDVYENDLNAISVGDKVNISIPNHQNISGQVSFISPVLEANSRSAKARVVIDNADQKLKPGVFVKAKLSADNKTGNPSKKLMIPKSAVLWTGRRSIVFQQLENDRGVHFKMKQITIGSSTTNQVEILSGLKPGDKIVTQGAFSIDSEAQLANKPSMMNPATNVEMTMNKDYTAMSKTSNSETVKNKKMTRLIENYIELKNALVNDDFNTAKTSYKLLVSKLSSLSDLNFKEPNEVKNLDHLRDSFITISEEIIALVNISNPTENKLYVQECPMANQSQGALWLSFSDQIRNPYYGASMLKCGSVVDSIP